MGTGVGRFGWGNADRFRKASITIHLEAQAVDRFLSVLDWSTRSRRATATMNPTQVHRSRGRPMKAKGKGRKVCIAPKAQTRDLKRDTSARTCRIDAEMGWSGSDAPAPAVD